MSEGERRLAAVMFTDIVGYAALTQSNESQAMEVLERHNRLLSPFFPRFHGRVVKTIGDSFLVEFDSALDAIRCATEIQSYLHDYNISSKEEWKIKLRIGIHLGDVIHQRGDVFGDAVNIASRILPIAAPEGICVSRQVYDQVQNKFDLPLKSLGTMQLKNVTSPMELYKLVLPWEEASKSSAARSDSRRIAVLPLVNMIKDPNDEYFAEGMTEELISTMSKIGELSVISSTSAMQYKERTKPMAEIGRELRAGTILEGSVRKAGNRVRVTIQMIDAEMDRLLWAESYDRELDDVFGIQRDIASRVAEVLSVKLLSSEKTDIEKEPTASTEAYTLYLKGRHYWNERTKDGNERALEYFLEALKLDENFALAYAGAADCQIVAVDYGWLRPIEGNPRAKEYALKSIEINPRLAEPHASLGSLLEAEWRWEEAGREYLKAITLKPSYATAYNWYMLHLQMLGEYKEALKQIEKAHELDPLSGIIGLNFGTALMLTGRLTEAIAQYSRVIDFDPSYSNARTYLGFAYYLASRTDEALSELERAVATSGGDPTTKANFGCLLGLAGKTDGARAILNELTEISKVSYVPVGAFARVFFSLGMIDEVFRNLEIAVNERTTRAIRDFKTHPWLSGVRKDPRWASLEKRIGLDRYQVEVVEVS